MCVIGKDLDLKMAFSKSKIIVTQSATKFSTFPSRKIEGLAHKPQEDPSPGADFRGHVDTLLGWCELGHELGDVAAGPLRLDCALLGRLVLHDRLDLVIALLWALHQYSTL